MNKCDYLVVGAGFAGAVIAERIASKLNKKVIAIDKKGHVGGNCYDYYDKIGILVQKYGPHVFHTNNKKVFDYLSRFTEWIDYKHKVLAYYNGKYYPLPMNIETVNMFYGLNLKNEEDVREFLQSKKQEIGKISNSRDIAISRFGKGLYDVFIKHYTKKQWDKYPEELDKSVLERLDMKFDKDPHYFKDKCQGLPKLGYSHLFNNLLGHENIKVLLNADFFKVKSKVKYKKIIYTGPIDKFFNYEYGRLEYRGIKFLFETLDDESFQPNSVVNYPEPSLDYTRITEFKKFYNKKSKKTIICKEFPFWGGEPVYPIINEKNNNLLQKYLNKAKNLKQVMFLGRLGQYRYFDMDGAVKGSLEAFDKIKNGDSNIS